MLKSIPCKYPFLIAIIIIYLGMATLVCAADNLVTVEIDGLSGQKKKNVETALELPSGIVRDGNINGRWLKRFVEKAPEKVGLALQPFGYYNSQTSANVVQEKTGNYRIQVGVDPGPETRIRMLKLSVVGEGADNREIRRELKAFPLKQSGILDHQLYEKGKLDLRVEANDEGYIEANYQTSKIQVFPEENVADIELILETGSLFFFGDVRIVEDQEMFEESYLRRFLSFKTGDVFSYKKLHTSRLNFYAANRFHEVLMVPLREEAEGRQIPIEVKLTPGKMQRLRPGVGYASDTGARVLLSYQHMNIRKGPHALLADFNVAEKQQFAETSYIIPQQKTVNDNLILTIGFLKEDLNTYDTKMNYAEVERAYGLGSGKTGSVALGYFREDYEIGTEDDIARVLMPALRYNQRSYDDPLNPHRGYQLRLELRGSYDDFLSDLTLAQVLAGGSFMYPLHPRFTLHTRVEGATTVKDDEFASIPPSLRFFVGGDNSVRGYSYKSRGPRDENGDVIGGDSLLVGSVECEYSLSENWGVAAFYDIGSAFNAPIDNTQFIEGVGIGFRRYTPIGPIKIDFAHRLSESHTLRVHFSVGFDI